MIEFTNIPPFARSILKGLTARQSRNMDYRLTKPFNKRTLARRRVQYRTKRLFTPTKNRLPTPICANPFKTK